MVYCRHRINSHPVRRLWATNNPCPISRMNSTAATVSIVGSLLTTPSVIDTMALMPRTCRRVPRTDRSACIWCSRMVVVPAMACSHCSAAEQALHRSMETDALCRSGLIGRLKPRSTGESWDMVVPAGAPRRTAVSGRMGVCAHNFAVPSGVAAGPDRHPGRTLRPDPPFQGAWAFVRRYSGPPASRCRAPSAPSAAATAPAQRTGGSARRRLRRRRVRPLEGRGWRPALGLPE